MKKKSTNIGMQCKLKFATQPKEKNFWQKWLSTTLTMLLMVAGSHTSFGQTAFNLATNNYTADFADITNWTANFATGIGASNFGSVAIGAGAGAANNVTAGTRTTKSSATFVTASSGGIQKGTGALQFLSTGSGATPEAVAVDLLLNFTGRNAGTLSFDWAAIDNGGTRPTSLRVFYSTDNITFTEITAAQVLDKENVATPLGSISTIALPVALNNVATARIRFYNHAGSATIGSGSRDKIQIDNISITSTSSVAAAPIITSANTNQNTTVLSAYAGYTITASNSPTLYSATGLPSGLSVNTATGAIFGTPITGTVNTYTVTASATNASGIGTTTFLLNVIKANQIITFGSLANKVLADPSITLSATSTSGLPISYATSNNAIANVVGTTLSFVGSGTTIITASQAGNTDYNAANAIPQNQVVTATPSSNQTITFSLPSSVVYGISPILLNGTSTSLLPITYTISNTSIANISGSNLLINGVGTTTITASQAGNASFNAATDVIQVITVTQKMLTVSGASANSKIYDKTNTAIISGATLVGVIGVDVVTISNTGIFASINVGTSIAVTSTQVLAGADAAKYTLLLPTSISANINAVPLTIAGASANNKVFDGTTVASLSGTITGVVATDIVTVSLTGIFASAAIGNNIAVTSTAVLGGADAANYTLVQPTGLVANIVTQPLYLNLFTGLAACPTQGNIAVVQANVIGDTLSRSTITCNSTGNVFNSSTLNATATISSTSYIQFAVSANAGYQLNLTSLSFFRQASNSAPNQLEVRYSTDNFATSTTWGVAPTTPTSGTIATWDFADFSTIVGGKVIFRIYPYGTQRADLTASAAATSGTFRLDSISITGSTTIVTNPIISSTGSLSSLTTNYGTASTSSNFNVSGADMLAGILVTPPSGFEVSLDNSTFASTVTVGGGGTIASTPVYIRLAASSLVGAYAGNIVLSSANATAVNVATVSSTVNAANVNTNGLTANNKVFDGTTTATLSGTPTLIGVLPADASNVILGGTPIATFASSAIGNGIAVTVTGFTISGSASSNYILVQPSLSANITSVATPVISSALAGSGTYATVITNYSITATNSPTSFSATGLPSGLTVNTATGEISGTPTVVGIFTILIAATNASGTGSVNLIYTITPKTITVTGAIANNKVYDKTNVAIISGATLVGVVGADVVTISNTGTFATVNVATSIVVTSTQVLSGADASKYTLVLPTGLSANINPKVITIGAAGAQDKSFDGTTLATITGTLIGVVATDVVTISLSGTFASSAIGTAIAVTSTSTIGGADAANYILDQPIGLIANILSGPTTFAIGDISIIGFNVNAPDNFAFATWVDINPNTFIKFTDNAFLSSGSATAAGNARGGENFIIWKSGSSVIPAGSVISIQDNTTVGITSNGSIISGNLSGLSSSGDNIFAYQGTAVSGANPDWTANTNPTTFNGTILFGLFASGSSAVNTWLATGVPSTNTSYLPSQLNISGGNIALGSLSSRGQFTGARNNQPSYANYKAIVTNPSNWTLGTGVGVTTLDLTPFTLGTTATPTISAIGNLSALTTIYGTASAETSFNVSGVDMTAGILVTPPTGYEVSLTSGTGFVATVTVGGTGTIAATSVYIRLASYALVGSYVGDIVLSSIGATAVNVATTASTVTTKALTISGITANNKLFDGNTAATIAGTASLVGVLSVDIANVILGGTPVATFASAALGTGIAVSVSGYSISGSGATNYSVIQPNGLVANITSSPSPVITSALNSSGTYATAITNYSITATNTPISFNATGLPAGLNINTATGEISGTPTVVGTFTIVITATNSGGFGNANLIYTIAPKTITVTGAIANNKVYDKTNAAIISGATLIGVVGADVVTISNTGIFATLNVATSIVVTSTQVLSGADSSKYILVLPTGLSANINPKVITIGAAGVQNKSFDGTTTATITGIITGVVATDVVTLTLSGTFASSAIGTAIAVTSTSTIGGADAANYILDQPIGLIANIIGIPTFTEVIFPQFIQGVNGTNINRIPFAYRATLGNLTPNATYRFYNSVELTTATATATGAGNNIFTGPIQDSNFKYSTGPSLTTIGNHGTFTTNTNGEYTGWFIIAPSGNATRFVPGTLLNTRIVLNDGNNGTVVASVLKSTSTIKVINTVAAAGSNNGTGLRGISSATAKNFVFAYDNIAGTGRPLSGTFVENDGAIEKTSFSPFYANNVDSVIGAYGIIVPNTNANGVQRIEQRDFTTGAIVGCPATDADGNWPSGVNTANPVGGTTALVITNTDAPLTPTVNTTTIIACNSYTWAINNITYSTSGIYFSKVGCATDTLKLTINNSTSSNTAVTATVPYVWAVNGTSYTTSGTYTNSSTNANGCPQNDTLVLTINSTSNAVLNAKLYLQGYWNGTNMVAARYDNLIAAGSATPGNNTDVDDVIIELRNATTYVLEYTANGILQTDGNLVITYPAGAVGNNYYLAVKHQSALQLWSANPVLISSTTTYDFSDDLAKAYTDGSNPPMALLASGVYGLYTGDVNGDEFIDITDYSLFEIDVDYSTILGLYNLPSDFNGDTFVDLTDYPLFDFNNSLSLYSQHP